MRGGKWDRKTNQVQAERVLVTARSVTDSPTRTGTRFTENLTHVHELGDLLPAPLFSLPRPSLSWSGIT